MKFKTKYFFYILLTIIIIGGFYFVYFSDLTDNWKCQKEGKKFYVIFDDPSLRPYGECVKLAEDGHKECFTDSNCSTNLCFPTGDTLMFGGPAPYQFSPEKAGWNEEGYLIGYCAEYFEEGNNARLVKKIPKTMPVEEITEALKWEEGYQKLLRLFQIWGDLH